MQFDWSFAWSILPELLRASQATVFITIASFACASVGGLAVLALRSSPRRFISMPATWVVDFIRSTPLLLQVFFVYYVLPAYGLTLGPVEAGIATLGVHYSCYMSEAYRSALAAVPNGQWEAAQALGLKRVQVFRKVIWPQMLPVVVPTGGSLMIYMFKDTPVLAAVTVREVLQTASRIGADNFRYLEPITIVGVLFLAMSLLAAWATRRLERRFDFAAHKS